MTHILVADDREGIRTFLKHALEAATYRVTTATNGKDALNQLNREHVDLLITDLKMPIMDGMALLIACRASHPDMPVIILTAHGTIDNAVRAIKAGAVDYLTKPLESPETLRRVVRRVLKERTTAHSPSRPTKSRILIATSPIMQQVLKLIDKVAPTDASVLLEGESGTGKEVAAREIHRLSSRKDTPFVPVNCAAISPQLVESELFGHEKGAFTGADTPSPGQFKQAHTGTLFLDEVGELPIGIQAKLLRALQEKEIRSVGSATPVKIDVRIIAATNRQLKNEVEAGTFREDLFHRLAVFPIYLPPLRDRPEDIMPLAEHLLDGLADKMALPRLSLSPDAVDLLKKNPWKGNIRELGNTLERGAILCSPPTIRARDLAPPLSSANEDTPSLHAEKDDLNLKEREKEAIVDALSQTDGHRKKAAALLGIGLRTLYNKLKEYGIE